MTILMINLFQHVRGESMNLNESIKRCFMMFHASTPITSSMCMVVALNSFREMYCYKIFQSHEGQRIANVSDMRSDMNKSLFEKDTHYVIKHRKRNIMLYAYIDDEFIAGCIG